MLRITVELLPGGDKARARHMGTATISLKGVSEQGTVGAYEATFSKWGRPSEAWKHSTVASFRRKTRGPWDLLYLALDAAVGSRNRRRERPQ